MTEWLELILFNGRLIVVDAGKVCKRHTLLRFIKILCYHLARWFLQLDDCLVTISSCVGFRATSLPLELSPFMRCVRWSHRWAVELRQHWDSAYAHGTVARPHRNSTRCRLSLIYNCDCDARANPRNERCVIYESVLDCDCAAMKIAALAHRSRKL
jgi:hypothetical protein